MLCGQAQPWERGAPRSVVQETADVGNGYRIGLGGGMLLRLSRLFGLVFELEWATQHVEHTLRYHRLDGAGGTSSLPVTYDLTWVSIAAGLAVMP